MFNPKFDMGDAKERELPRELTFKKKPPITNSKVVVLGIAIALAGIFLWATVSNAKACQSESSTSVESRHTIIFKKYCKE